MNAFSAGKRQVYDAVNMIHDVIRGANPFPYSLLLNSCFSVLEIIELNKPYVER